MVSIRNWLQPLVKVTRIELKQKEKFSGGLWTDIRSKRDRLPTNWRVARTSWLKRLITYIRKLRGSNLGWDTEVPASNLGLEIGYPKGFRGFIQYLLDNAGRVPQMRSQSLPYKSFPIQYSWIVISQECSRRKVLVVRYESVSEQSSFLLLGLRFSHRWLWWVLYFSSCWFLAWPLKTIAIFSSETPVYFNRTTRHCISEGRKVSVVYSYSRELNVIWNERGL
jgi:hypothetical protein